MTVVEHLTELRSRLVISLIALAVGATICFIFAPQIISFLVRFYRDATEGKRNALIFTGPLDAFATRLKIATYGGIVVASPVWLWELWRFITPGLNPTEKRYAVPFLFFSLFLFVCGAAVALVTLEPALHFLLTIGGSDLKPLLAADRYISLVSLMIVAFGISFEFPVVLVFLLIARVLTTAQLRSWRRYAAVVIVIFAAVITPSQDPYSLFAMAIPMYLFYEASILIGRILKR
ncbi:MAG: twin-arginine translocase subunit TatC [Acidimicrobiia bacterium]